MLNRKLAAVVVLALVAGCSSRHAESAASESASPESAAPVTASPAPLRSCETRELHLDGADVVVTSNADGTLATVTVSAPSAAAKASAQAAVRADFGAAHKDTRVITHQSKWGFPILTDACGRTVRSSPT